MAASLVKLDLSEGAADVHLHVVRVVGVAAVHSFGSGAVFVRIGLRSRPSAAARAVQRTALNTTGGGSAAAARVAAGAAVTGVARRVAHPPPVAAAPSSLAAAYANAAGVVAGEEDDAITAEDALAWNETLLLQTRGCDEQAASVRIELCWEPSDNGGSSNEAPAPATIVGGCDVPLAWLLSEDVCEGAGDYCWKWLQLHSDGGKDIDGNSTESACGRLLVGFARTALLATQRRAVQCAAPPPPLPLPNEHGQHEPPARCADPRILELFVHRARGFAGTVSRLGDGARYVVEARIAGPETGAHGLGHGSYAVSSAAGQDLEWGQGAQQAAARRDTLLRLSVQDGDLAQVRLVLRCVHQGEGAGSGLAGSEGGEGGGAAVSRAQRQQVLGETVLAATGMRSLTAHDSAVEAAVESTWVELWQPGVSRASVHRPKGELLVSLASRAVPDHTATAEQHMSHRTAHSQATSSTGSGGGGGGGGGYRHRGPGCCGGLPNAGTLKVRVLSVLGVGSPLRDPYVRMKLAPTGRVARTAAASFNDGPGHAIEFPGGAPNEPLSIPFVDPWYAYRMRLAARRPSRGTVAQAREADELVAAEQSDAQNLATWSAPSLRFELAAAQQHHGGGGGGSRRGGALARTDIALATIMQSGASFDRTLVLHECGAGSGARGGTHSNTGDGYGQLKVQLQFMPDAKDDTTTGGVMTAAGEQDSVVKVQQGVFVIRVLRVRAMRRGQNAPLPPTRCAVHCSLVMSGQHGSTRVLKYKPSALHEAHGIACGEELCFETYDASSEQVELSIVDRSLAASAAATQQHATPAPAQMASPLGRSFLCGDALLRGNHAGTWVKIFEPVRSSTDGAVESAIVPTAFEVFMAWDFVNAIDCGSLLARNAESAAGGRGQEVRRLRHASEALVLPPVMQRARAMLGAGFLHVQSLALVDHAAAAADDDDSKLIFLRVRLGHWEQILPLDRSGDSRFKFHGHPIAVPMDWHAKELRMPLLTVDVVESSASDTGRISNANKAAMRTFELNVAPLALQGRQLADLRLAPMQPPRGSHAPGGGSGGEAELHIQCAFHSDSEIIDSAFVGAELQKIHASINMAGNLHVHFHGARRISWGGNHSPHRRIAATFRMLDSGGANARTRPLDIDKATGNACCDEEYHLKLSFQGVTPLLDIRLVEVISSDGGREEFREIGVLSVPVLPFVFEGHLCDSWWPLMGGNGNKSGEVRVALQFIAGTHEKSAAAASREEQKNILAAQDHLIFATVGRGKGLGDPQWLGEMELSARVELVDPDSNLSVANAQTKLAQYGGRNPLWRETLALPLPYNVLMQNDDDDAQEDGLDSDGIAMPSVKVTVLDANRLRDRGVVGEVHFPLARSVVFDGSAMQKWFNVRGTANAEQHGQIFLTLNRGSSADSDAQLNAAPETPRDDEAAAAAAASRKSMVRDGVLYLRSNGPSQLAYMYPGRNVVTVRLLMGGVMLCETCICNPVAETGKLWDGLLVLPMPAEKEGVRVEFTICPEEHRSESDFGNQSMTVSKALSDCGCLSMPMRPSQTWFGATRHSNGGSRREHAADEGLNVEMQFVPPRCGKLYVSVLRANGIGGRSTSMSHGPIDAFIKAKFMPSGEFQRTSVSTRTREVGFFDDELVFEYSNESEQEEPQMIFELMDDRPVLHNVVGRSVLSASPFLAMDSGRVVSHTVPLHIVGDASHIAELVLAFRFVEDGMSDESHDSAKDGAMTASEPRNKHSSAKIHGDVKRLFYMLDDDHNGWVTTSEFTTALKANPEIRVMLGGGQSHHETPEQTALRIFKEIDSNADQFIVWTEFMNFVEHATQKRERAMRLTVSSPRHKTIAKHSPAKSKPPSMALAHSDTRVLSLTNDLAKSHAHIEHLSTQLAKRQSGGFDQEQDNMADSSEAPAALQARAALAKLLSPSKSSRRVSKARRPLSVVNDPRVVKSNSMARDRESLEHEVLVLRVRVAELEDDKRKERTQKLLSEARIRKECEAKMSDFLNAESLATQLFKSSRRHASSSSLPPPRESDLATREQILDLQTINLELRKQLKCACRREAEGESRQRDTKPEVNEDEPTAFASPAKPVSDSARSVEFYKAELKRQRHEMDDVLTHCKWLQDRLTEKREKVKALKQTCSSTQSALKLEKERNMTLKTSHESTLQQLRNFERAEFLRNRSHREKKIAHDAQERDLRLRREAQRATTIAENEAATRLQSHIRGGMYRRASVREENTKRQSAVKIQSQQRGRLQRQRFDAERSAKRGAACVMQARVRNTQARRRFDQIMAANRLMQRYVRGVRGRKAVKRRKRAILKIQSVTRGHKARADLDEEAEAEERRLSIEEAALCLTSVAHMYLCRQKWNAIVQAKEDAAFVAAVQEEAASFIQEQFRKLKPRKISSEERVASEAAPATEAQPAEVAAEAEAEAKAEVEAKTENGAKDPAAAVDMSKAPTVVDESKLSSSAVKIQSRWRVKNTDLQMKQDTTQRFATIQSYLSPSLQAHLKAAFDGKSLFEQQHILKGLETLTPEQLSKTLDAQVFWEQTWKRIRFLPESLSLQVEGVCRFMVTAHREAFIEMIEVLGDVGRVSEIVSALEEMPVFDNVGAEGWVLLPNVPVELRLRLFEVASAEEADVATGAAQRFIGDGMALLRMLEGQTEEDVEHIICDLEGRIAEAKMDDGRQLGVATVDDQPAAESSPAVSASSSALSASSAEAGEAVATAVTSENTPAADTAPASVGPSATATATETVEPAAAADV